MNIVQCCQIKQTFGNGNIGGAQKIIYKFTKKLSKRSCDASVTFSDGSPDQRIRHRQRKFLCIHSTVYHTAQHYCSPPEPQKQKYIQLSIASILFILSIIGPNIFINTYSSQCRCHYSANIFEQTCCKSPVLVICVRQNIFFQNNSKQDQKYSKGED